MLKRILCVCICAFMLMENIPVGAYAEEPEKPFEEASAEAAGQEEGTEQIEENKEEESKESIPLIPLEPSFESVPLTPLTNAEEVIFQEALIPAEELMPLETQQALNAPQGVHEEQLNDNGNGFKTQIFKAEDGTNHTIYWAKGINPPLMTTDPELLGKAGYFERIDEQGYRTYQAPYEQGMGYYDLNKTGNNNYCYLGSSSNIIYWWLDQNAAYIEAYLDGLKSGKFKQEDGLVPLTDEKWEAVLADPVFRDTEFGYISELTQSPLIRAVFGVYLNREDGCFMDIVQDFFFNGYPSQAETTKLHINSEDDYTKDPKGGYFHSIFGKTRLSRRIEGGKYRNISNSLKGWIEEGKGVTLGYYINNVAHAITIWGAEYDQNGNLDKIYVTDTDDWSNNTVSYEKNDPRGLHSMRVYEDSKGILRITNNMENKGGSIIQELVTLDLGTEMWEDALYGDDEVRSPEIISQPAGRSYGKGAPADPITFTLAGERGSEYYTYQWYKSSSKEGEGVKIAGADKASYTPDLNEISGKAYFYCEVTAHKFGYETTARTQSAEIEVTGDEAVNALPPSVYFNSYLVHVPQGDNYTIHVNADSRDGGTLSYQWFEAADSSSSTRWNLKGETSSSFKVPTNAAGRRFYGCIVTNTKEGINGKRTAEVITGAKAVYVDESSLKDQENSVLVSVSDENPAFGDVIEVNVTGGSGEGDLGFTVLGSGEKTSDGKIKVTGVGEIKITGFKNADGTYKSNETVKVITSKRAKSADIVTSLEAKINEEKSLDLLTLNNFPSNYGGRPNFAVIENKSNITAGIKGSILNIKNTDSSIKNASLKIAVTNMANYEPFKITVSLAFTEEEKIDTSVTINAPNVGIRHEIFIDGAKADFRDNGDGSYTIDKIEGTDKKDITMYHYNEKGVPVGMRVWMLSYNDGKYSAAAVPELDDLISYHGFSIRTTNPSGIRFKSGIEKAAREALLSEDGLAGFKLINYGTIIMNKKNIDLGYPVVADSPKVGKGLSYGIKSDGSFIDAVLEEVDGRYRFASVRTNMPVKDYKKEFGYRGFITLEKDGEEVVLYGPTVERSIYTVAKQLQRKNPVGSPMYNFVTDLIKKADDYKGE